MRTQGREVGDSVAERPERQTLDVSDELSQAAGCFGYPIGLFLGLLFEPLSEKNK